MASPATKRHLVVDATGLLLAVAVTGAHIQDRDGGYPLIWAVRHCFLTITLVWADSGYRGKLVDWTASLGITLQIVAKLAGQIGFVVQHRRWVVERSFSWINRCRRNHPRLRTTPRTPRRDGPLGDDYHHDPPTRPLPSQRQIIDTPRNRRLNPC
jgi:transposase